MAEHLPDLRRPPSGQRLWFWFRYRSWTVVVGALLIGLGLANIYPFVWMAGTSLKSQSEANLHRERAVPAWKYFLTDAGDALAPRQLESRQLEILAELQTHEEMRRAVGAGFPRRLWQDGYKARFSTDPAGAARDLADLAARGWIRPAPPLRQYSAPPPATQPTTRPALPALLPRQSQLLSRLGAAAAGTPALTDEQYAGEHHLDLARAHEELAPLVAAGLLKVQEQSPAYQLADAGLGPLLDGLNARQLMLLRVMQLEDTKNRQTLQQETFLHVRVTPEEYADKTGLYAEEPREIPDVKKARAELAAIDKAAAAQKAATDPAAAAAAVAALSPRQQALLAEWRERLLQGRPAAHLLSPLAYADRFGLVEQVKQRKHDLKQATAEMEAMRQRGLLEANPFLWQNYLVVLKDMRLYLNVLTSLALTAGVVTLTILISSMLGYALARVSFPGKFWVLGIMLIGAVAPTEGRIIPVFRMIQGAGLLDGLWGMVLWMTGAGIGNALLMAGFFLSLPKEVEEAARVDGAGPFRTFFDVAFPMARPIVMTIGLFAFMGAWNDFLVPFICTQTNPNLQPLAVAVYTFQQGKTGFWQLTNAAAAIMIVPVLVLFVLLQKHIVKSIAVGAVKG